MQTKEEIRESKREWRKKNPDKIKKQKKKWRDNNKDKVKNMRRRRYLLADRNSQLVLRYGVTLEDYSKMLEKQNFCCAICGKNQSEFKKALHVDHNHKTNKVRALLCWKCNYYLGIFEASKDKFEKYLVEYPW